MWGFHEGMVWWMLGFWTVTIGLVIWGVKRFTDKRGEGRTQGDTPLEIAQKRLAPGEITREQFEEPRKAL